MRGAIIFAIATLVVPALTAAVPPIDTTSINVESDVKRHAEVVDTDQAKRTSRLGRLPIIQRVVLAERGKIVHGGSKRDAEPVEDLEARDRRVNWRSAEPVEDLEARDRRVNWRSAEPVEDLEARDRRVNWRSTSEPTENLVE